VHRLRNMACVRGIGPYQLGLRRDRGVRLVAPTAQRLRRDPRSLATCSIALVSDEYEPRDSVDSLTAFALNSGVYLVPFAMVPSSPIELGEMRNKNQFISVWFQMEGGGAEFNLWTGRACGPGYAADGG